MGCVGFLELRHKCGVSHVVRLEAQEPLVWRQGSQVSMSVARGSASLLSCHDRGFGPQDLYAIGPLGEIRIKGASSTGRYIPWKSPEECYQGTSGNSRAVWPGPYHSAPKGCPRATGDKSWRQGFLGGGKPHGLRCQAACFFPLPVHFCLQCLTQAVPRFGAG